MILSRITNLANKNVNVVIETPRGSANKFAYNKEMELFFLKKTLPLGMVFPFDFGFIPNTKGGDGDPLDILVISEGTYYPGCLVECRLIGILKAEQKEANKKVERNDRLIGVPVSSIIYTSIKQVEDLNSIVTTQITDFFINYNEIEKKKFKPILLTRNLEITSRHLLIQGWRR